MLTTSHPVRADIAELRPRCVSRFIGNECLAAKRRTLLRDIGPFLSANRYMPSLMAIGKAADKGRGRAVQRWP